MSTYRTPIAELLQAFEALHGPPPTGKMDVMVKVWHTACQRFTDAQIIKATEPLLTKKTFGWPKPSDLAECIEGRIIKVPEYATDLGGARYRERHGGPLCIERWHEVHVPFDWEGDPGEFNWADMPREMKDYHYAQVEGQKAIGGGE